MAIGSDFPVFKLNKNAAITFDGGYAVRMVNKTGATSVQGNVIESDGTVTRGVDLIGIDDPDPMGIVYDAGIPDGGDIWVVVSGLAYVLYSTDVSATDLFARAPESGDGSATAGQAIAEVLPVPPFSSDKHFQEIGHPQETIGAPGLALTMLHFN